MMICPEVGEAEPVTQLPRELLDPVSGCGRLCVSTVFPGLRRGNEALFFLVLGFQARFPIIHSLTWDNFKTSLCAKQPFGKGVPSPFSMTQFRESGYLCTDLMTT